MIPCALSNPERRLLAELADGRVVVEAGALLGGSTVHLAQSAAWVVSIDRHEGYTGDTWAQYRTNLLRHSAYNVRPIRGCCLHILPAVPADVAFIDLTGERALTTGAILALHPSIPLVAVHDFGRQNCDVPERVPGWRPYRRVDTLLVMERICKPSRS